MAGFKACILVCAFAAVTVLAADKKAKPITLLAANNKQQHTYEATQEIMKEFYAGCGSKKFCLGFEKGCEEALECQYFVSISVSFNESFARFQLTKKGLGYVAVGLSHDDKIGEDSVIACVQAKNKDNPANGVFSIWVDEQGKFADLQKAEANDDLSDFEIDFRNENIICQFDLTLNSTRHKQVFDLTNKKDALEIFLLMGNVTTSATSKYPVLHIGDNVNKTFVLPGGDDDDQPSTSSSTNVVLQAVFVVFPTIVATMLLR